MSSWPALDEWTPVLSGDGYMWDPPGDTGNEGHEYLDIVGDQTNFPAAYMNFRYATNTTTEAEDQLLFRIRVDDRKNNNMIGAYQIFFETTFDSGVDYYIQLAGEIDDGNQADAVVTFGAAAGYSPSGVQFTNVIWSGNFADYGGFGANDGSQIGGELDYFIDLVMPLSVFTDYTGIHSTNDAFRVLVSTSQNNGTLTDGDIAGSDGEVVAAADVLFSDTFSETVAERTEQTITDFTPTNGSVFFTSSEVVLSAESTSGLPVEFTVISGGAVITEGTNLTFTTNGTVTVSASQGGSPEWDEAPTIVNTYAVHGVPVVGGVTLQRMAGETLKFTVATLLANSSDPEGSALTVSAVSSNGGSVELSGRWVIYTPLVESSEDDYFEFSVSNAYGGTSVGTATVETVVQEVRTKAINIHAITASGGAVLKLIGIPGRVYTVEGADSPTSTEWEDLGTCTITEEGYALFSETNTTADARFYRLKY